MLDLVSIFGLRFGLGMQLQDTDPLTSRIGVWDPKGNSMLYDVLLFAVLVFQEPLLKSEWMAMHSRLFVNASKKAAARVHQVQAAKERCEGVRLAEIEQQLLLTQSILSGARDVGGSGGGGGRRRLATVQSDP